MPFNFPGALFRQSDLVDAVRKTATHVMKCSTFPESTLIINVRKNMISRLATPSTSHLDFSTIYEPAEDSFLFLDTLSSDRERSFLAIRLEHATTTASPLIIEIGTGSGVILAFATAHAKIIFGRSDIVSLGIDVNENACRGSAETVRRAVTDSKKGEAEMLLGCVQADLATCLRPGSVDVLLFNPPYVPTEELPDKTKIQHNGKFEQESHLLALSYAGGVDGMEVTERLLQQLPDVLSRRGVAYVLFCARNKTTESLKRVMSGETWQNGEEWNWATEVVGQTGGKGGWERLEIVRIWRRSKDGV